MRKEKLIVGVMVVSMIAIFGGVGFAVLNASNSSNNKKVVKSAKTTVVSPESESSLSVGNNSGLGAGVQGQGQSLTQESQPNSSQSQTTAPKPEDYTQYEKYKDSKTALFGEVKAGTGKVVASGSQVAIYYVGRLTDGSIFDQSRPEKEGEQPKPFIFTIGKSQVIPGMEQGIFGMKVGGTRRIIIPPAAGYGAKGQGPVPANAVMIFDVQLLEVK